MGQLKVIRDIKAKGYTLGRLLVDGQFFCFTCEDEVREVPNQPPELWKIKGKTAIPVGTYRLSLRLSNRFQKVLPAINNVPGFEGILIHGGNTAADTEGCLLVGMNRSKDGVFNCAPAVQHIKDLITADPSLRIQIS